MTTSPPLKWPFNYTATYICEKTTQSYMSITHDDVAERRAETFPAITGAIHYVCITHFPKTRANTWVQHPGEQHLPRDINYNSVESDSFLYLHFLPVGFNHVSSLQMYSWIYLVASRSGANDRFCRMLLGCL